MARFKDDNQFHNTLQILDGKMKNFIDYNIENQDEYHGQLNNI